jgi:hypothetical protein
MKKLNMTSVRGFSAGYSRLHRLNRGLGFQNKLIVPVTLAAVLTLSLGCGGSKASSPSSSPVGPPPPPPANPNVLPVTVNGGNNSVNIMSASVTVCMPGTTTCQTVSGVQVDTGSTGLRLFSSALSLSLPQISTGAGPSFECGVFPNAGQYTWGPMVMVDVKIAGETAASLPIQLIGDPTQAPASCSSGLTGASPGNVPYQSGILGISMMPQDCPGCASVAAPQFYYACSSGTNCQPAIQPLSQQAENPVILFSTDNNGEIVELPAISSSGNSSATGSVVFGIGTEANNQIGSNVIFQEPLTTAFNGGSYPTIIDSGAGQDSFPNTIGLPVCGGFYCPSMPTSFTAVLQGQNGAFANLTVVAADPNTLSLGADNNVVAPSSDSVTLGLPFFFGHNVFFAIQGSSTPSGPGPYVALQ